MASASLKEKLDKIRSPNLQNQKQTASVLEGVESAFAERKTEVTPTAYFAALLSLLDNKSLVTPVVYLLDVVTPFAPEPLLRAKFTQILALLAPVLTQPDADAPLIRSSLGCLESLLLAQDAAAWDMSTAQVGPRRAVGGLLGLALDPRPKVRKRAQEALRKVLKNPPPSPSLDHPAAPMCAETAMQSLRDLAEKATTSQKEKKASEPLNIPELIHALQLVKSIASASGGWPSTKIESLCELLLAIARSGSEHMSIAVFDVFEMIFEGMADEVASAKLPRLIEIIKELRPASGDTQLLPPWLAIYSRAYDVSAQISPEETFQELAEPFALVAKYLESEAKNIRISASECLVSFMANCVPHQVLLDPSVYDEKVLRRLVKTAESLLTVNYQQAWLETFNVLGAMFDALRWRASPYLLGVAKTIGEMRSVELFAGKQEADEVIGKAIRAMGPEAVLEVLPLNLATPVRGQPGRAWMLPLMRDYVSNTNLAHFRSELVPLSAIMFQRVMDHGEEARTMEIKIYETVVNQIWSILPGYCDLPLDLTVAFDTPFAEMLTNLLYEQVDLRLGICRALKTLVESNQAIASLEGEDDLVLQSRLSKEDAQENLDFLGATYAGDLLAVLFNVYSTTLPQKRGPVLQTINAFLSIIPSARLQETFDLVCEKLAAALQEVPAKHEKQTQEGEQPKKAKKKEEQLPSTAQTLMDLVVTMSIYLPRESFEALFKIASLVIIRDDDPQLQKKAYKLIPRLADSPLGKVALEQRSPELQTLLLSSAEKVSAPARRDRLAAIAALIPSVPDTELHFIPSILSEVVISCKEHNERARITAFDLLVLMGEKMTSAKGALIDNSKVPHMTKDALMAPASIEEYVTMVSAGLAGSTPHMISASITAITRILYEFRETLSLETTADLVQTMDLFLTSNNREIVKSVLGFVKVCIISSPTDMVLPRLGTLVPNLMVWSHEHKGHFRSKVKHILERMIRRFGVETVNKYCPEADKKLITNIRKTKERNKRKKDASRDADDSEDGEEDKRTGRFESEYDQALYSSDESGQSGESDTEMGGKPTKASRKGAKGGNAYIVEDEDEPLDLLDRNALANISSTRPVKLKLRTKSKAKMDLDGKLIFGKDDNDGAMDIDTTGGEGESGVGAYVAALRGKDAPRRGLRGKIKWSNGKKGGDDDDDEDGMDVDDSAARALKSSGFRSRGDGKSRGMSRGRGGGGRGGGGGGGGDRGDRDGVWDKTSGKEFKGGG
ncbi:NUC173 domain-containing protein [Lasiosphaeria miniovina]|uniref:NUC173 domain-containing protein n=1 Tax=Lasiosphaeria miniovina TaxID=1954250 RepID=A0AA39ZZW7_9PEZI|nr:NUC173 domain-containing protein [Lasiosphaeria miniovina]KAK0706708.1 NUC173 domain-containing protein [Lasiosphaeria miniovina]